MRLFLPRYFGASILLLLVLVAVFATLSARRTQQELRRQLEERGLALAEVFETSSRNAIRGNVLMEEMIAQRLFDNARLIDQLLLSGPLDKKALAEISVANRLRRVDLLDSEGRPYIPPPMPRGMRGMMGMMPPAPGAEAQRHQEMTRFMWGRRWGGGGETGTEERKTERPPALRERKFWEGSLFGVAISARSFHGIIAVHADADYILNFRNEIGVERAIEELGRQPGIEEVALLGSDLTLLAHSDASRIGQRENDPVVRQALSEQRSASRLVAPEGKESFEVLRLLTLDGSRLGLLRIVFSTAPMERAWQQDLRSALTLSLAILLVGALGMGFIFYIQHRHLSEVKRLESEVERRERLSSLGNLAAVVGHEIRNPLNAISMGLQRLRREFQPNDNLAEYTRMVDVTQGEVKRLNGIVEEFLSLARPLPLKLESVKVEELLKEVTALVEADAESRGVRIVLNAPFDLPLARWDRDQMKQLLLNLVVNSFEAMPQGGTLTVAASALRKALVLAVEDTGEGVPPDLLPKVFEPYVTSKTKGLGLGLAIARRIVEAHGGTIEAKSQAGKGSVFTVTIPCEAVGRQSNIPLQSPQSKIQNPKDG